MADKGSKDVSHQKSEAKRIKQKPTNKKQQGKGVYRIMNEVRNFFVSVLRKKYNRRTVVAIASAIIAFAMLVVVIFPFGVGLACHITCKDIFDAVKNTSSEPRKFYGWVKDNGKLVAENSGTLNPGEDGTVSWSPPKNYVGTVTTDVEVYDENGKILFHNPLKDNLDCRPTVTPWPSSTPTQKPSTTPTTPPTVVPPTAVPPTAIPPTTIPPTVIPPTAVPPTAVPPTIIPPTAVPPTPLPQKAKIKPVEAPKIVGNCHKDKNQLYMSEGQVYSHEVVNGQSINKKLLTDGELHEGYNYISSQPIDPTGCFFLDTVVFTNKSMHEVYIVSTEGEILGGKMFVTYADQGNWSSNGLAYLSDGYLVYEMNPWAQYLRRTLSISGWGMSFSPDGQFIAFITPYEAGREIWFINLKNEDIIKTQVKTVGFMNWTPDGKWLCFKYEKFQCIDFTRGSLTNPFVFDLPVSDNIAFSPENNNPQESIVQLNNQLYLRYQNGYSMSRLTGFAFDARNYRLFTEDEKASYLRDYMYQTTYWGPVWWITYDLRIIPDLLPFKNWSGINLLRE